MLTAATERLLQSGLPIYAFPPTIRDAIFATYKLGFAYLWIDALCIFQDSKEDKNVELIQMHNYYHNATLCLQPTGVRSVQDSFLRVAEMVGTHLQQSLTTSLPRLRQDILTKT
jgi:hypothetical protein